MKGGYYTKGYGVDYLLQVVDLKVKSLKNEDVLAVALFTLKTILYSCFENELKFLSF